MDRDAAIVDQELDRSKTVERRPGNGVDLIFILDVRLDREGAHAQRFDLGRYLLDLFELGRGQNDVRTFLRELERDGAADAPPTARNDRGFALKLHV